MANTRVSDLASGGAFVGTDLFYVVETVGVGGVQKTVTQFEEFIEDVVGAQMTDTATIDFTYTDGTGAITADVKTGSIQTTQLGGDITTAGKALLDDADASAQLTTLGGAGVDDVLGNLGIRVFSANIDDDAAVAIDIGSRFSSYIIIVGNSSSAGTGQARARTVSTASMAIIAQEGSVINVVSGDGTLTGTDGTDGKLNIRTGSAATRLYLENRIGFAGNWSVFLFA